jgi:hypothetical protein
MIDLNLVKRQCRVDYDDDDALLMGLWKSANDEVIRLTGRTEKELKEMGDGDDLPSPLEQAILIRVAQFYRDPEGSDKPNPTFESLIRPYQKI